jgi:putative hydrolase of the HAD superfamily
VIRPEEYNLFVRDDKYSEWVIMVIKAVLFDIYGTLVDIETDEKDWFVYENLSKFLSYYGLNLTADELKKFFFEKIKGMIEDSSETYPEIDVRRIWYEILSENENPQLYKLNLDQGTFLRDVIVLHRALTRRKLRLYDATYDVLKLLKRKYRIGIVSDSQYDYVVPETKILGITQFFDAFIISGEYGFRKPDKRLFYECLSKIGLSPSEVVFVGNNPFRDIDGAKSIGMKTILIMTRDPKDSDQAKPDFKVFNIGDVPKLIETKLLNSTP